MKNKYLLGASVGLLVLVVSIGLNALISMAFPGLSVEYVNPSFRPWADPLMSLFFLYPIVFGIFLSWLWLKTRNSWGSGLEFGLAMAVFTGVPSFLVNFSSFTFSTLMMLSWALMGAVNSIAAGLILEKLEK